MKLTLYRDAFTDVATSGKLFIGGQMECYILEDVDRKLESGGTKIKGQTAIPRGTYQIIVNMSNRFKRMLPLLVNVPGFDGIRIHPGNTSADTEGCLLPGVTRNVNSVGSSRVAFNSLFDKLTKAYNAGELITIEVK